TTDPLPQVLLGPETAGFLPAIEPLLRRALDRLRQGTRALAAGRGDLPFDPATVEAILLRHLPASLCCMLARTLVLELPVASLQGELAGDTPADRYLSFVRRLRRPEVRLALFREYPVLARLVALSLENFVKSTLTFLGRLCADAAAIRS